MSAVSVIICTHDPRPDYLSRTLESLRAQALPQNQWELIVIDNASSKPIGAETCRRGHPGARVVIESDLGLTPARLRGIRESRAPLLVFVDDDNILAPDFLQQALAIAAGHPHLGAFGAGVLEPEFEAQPNPEIKPLLHRLALRTARCDLWSNNLRDSDCCPWGAGLCVRRQTAARFAELVGRIMVNGILDRKGRQLTSNGDDLFTWAAVSVGQGFGIFTALRITHLIAARRVSPEYMVRLVRDSRVSECVLYFLLEGTRPRPMSLMMLVRAASYLRHGLFALRCRWAAAQGEGRAARFIVEHRLQPM